MSPADIVVLLLVAAAIVCAVVHSVRARKKRGGGCGCGCKVENCEIFAQKYVLIWIAVCAILC